MGAGRIAQDHHVAVLRRLRGVGGGVGVVVAAEAREPIGEVCSTGDVNAASSPHCSHSALPLKGRAEVRIWIAVSYTHLDVYKRQDGIRRLRAMVVSWCEGA